MRSRRSKLHTAISQWCRGKFVCCAQIISLMLLHALRLLDEHWDEDTPETNKKYMCPCWLVSKTQIMPHTISYFRKYIVLCVIKLHAHQALTNYTAAITTNMITAVVHNEGWFLQVFVIYCLYYVWEDPILCLSEGSKTGMSAPILQTVIWRIVHIFKAAHTPHPWINLSELAPKLIHTCCIFGILCICAVRLLSSVTLSITKCQRAVGACCC